MNDVSAIKEKNNIKNYNNKLVPVVVRYTTLIEYVICRYLQCAQHDTEQRGAAACCICICGTHMLYVAAGKRLAAEQRFVSVSVKQTLVQRLVNRAPTG